MFLTEEHATQCLRKTKIKSITPTLERLVKDGIVYQKKHGAI
jgi:hypothetical protein